MITIQADSPAFDTLRNFLVNPDTYKVSIAVREDLEQISVKRNEGMWTGLLSVNKKSL